MRIQFLHRMKALVAVCFLAGAVVFGQAGEALDAALDKAGDNRGGLEAFIATAQKTHGDLGKRAAEFLVEGMPPGDLTSIDREFLTENLDLAIKARAEFPWCAQLSEELFFNDVLPYASLDETRERWRPEFYNKCRAIVAKASTATEAVQAIRPFIAREYGVTQPMSLIYPEYRAVVRMAEKLGARRIEDVEIPDGPVPAWRFPAPTGEPDA